MNDELARRAKCDDAEVMRLWREVGLPEYFLGNGGTNHKLVAFVARIRVRRPANSPPEADTTAMEAMQHAEIERLRKIEKAARV